MSDIEIAERVLASYNKTLDHPWSEKGDLWDNVHGRQKDYIEVLESNNAETLVAFFKNPYNSATSGILPKDSDQSTKLDMLSLVVGAKGAANLPKYFKDNYTVEVIPRDKDIEGLYNAWFFRHFCNPKRILEIGAGAGRTAYWNNKFGVEDYTIIDLPYTNVYRAYHLIKELGGDSVYLYGEEGSKKRINILPDFEITKFDTPYFDLVLNQDSMTEINGDIVKGYLEQIKKCCKGHFVSINQELCVRVGDFVHHFLPDTIKEVGGFDLMLRTQYSIRQGYMMEVYRV